MRAKREMRLQDVPDAVSDDVRGPLERVPRAEDLEPDVVDGYLEETNENDETDRTLTVDPFSAEEERIITVLSRKLEQLREYETTSPLSPVEASSPPIPLPTSSSPADSEASTRLGRRSTPHTLSSASVAAPQPSENGRRFGATKSSARPPTAPAASSHKLPPKRVSPPPPTTKGYSVSSYTYSQTSSVGSGIYASSPSPTPSSPSSVYAAGAASPIHHRNGSNNANGSSSRPNGETKSNNGHAVPIAVNGSAASNGHAKGKGTHHHHHHHHHHHRNSDDGSGAGGFNSAYGRGYEAHISTLSSPEMSLSASPCETYDTRWMGSKNVHPNGSVFGAVNGNGKARLDVRQRESEKELMIHALMQENERLKSRIGDVEGDYMRLARLNEAYREELIGYRRRLGLPVDNLIGFASDPSFPSTSTFARPQGPSTYHHPPSSSLNNDSYAFNSYTGSTNGTHASQYHRGTWNASSPSNSMNISVATHTGRNTEHGSRVAENGASTNGVPIPRPPSQVHANRDTMMPMSVRHTQEGLLHRTADEFSTSASSVRSPTYPSPPYSANSPAFFSPPYSSAASSSAASSSAASSASASTNVTSPPSSMSLTMMMMTLGVPSRGLSYPAVPPPSLSSSVGSGGSLSP